MRDYPVPTRQLLEGCSALYRFASRWGAQTNLAIEWGWALGRLGLLAAAAFGVTLALGHHQAYPVIMGFIGLGAAFSLLVILLLLRRGLYQAAFVIGVAADTAIFLSGWVYSDLFLDTARATNDLYLVLLPIVALAVPRLGWKLGAAYTAFWLAWLAVNIVFIRGPDTYDYRQLPIRLFFLGVTAAVMMWLVARLTREQRRVESLLRRHDALWQRMSDAALVTNSAGDVVVSNQAAQRLLRASAESLRGKRLADLVCPDQRGAFQQAFARASLGEEVLLEVNLAREGEASAPVELHGSMVEVDGAALFQALIRDLSERRRWEQQFIQQERLRALGQMSSGVAHDFNNSLQPVLGFTDLLLMRPELLERSPVARNYLQLIRTAAQDAADVVNRLREFYGQSAPAADFGPVDLAQVARRAIALTRPRWKDQAAARGQLITLETEIKGPVIVLGDESKLREALINLIFNAVDAMPNGGTLTIAVSEQGGQAALSARDNGIGMSAEVRQRCLEPFFTTKGEGGSGLGLPMVCGISQQHQGTLEIESAEGKGTCVTLRLPLCPDPDPKLGAIGLDYQPPAALRVLLADDDERVATALAEYLLVDGHQVAVVSSGRAALERFKQEKFDVVLTDQAMPGMSGGQLALALKTLRPEAPVALLTGFSNFLDNEGGLPPGVDLILSKPIGLNGLRRTLAELTASPHLEPVAADGVA